MRGSFNKNKRAGLPPLLPSNKKQFHILVKKRGRELLKKKHQKKEDLADEIVKILQERRNDPLAFSRDMSEIRAELNYEGENSLLHRSESVGGNEKNPKYTKPGFHLNNLMAEVSNYNFHFSL